MRGCRLKGFAEELEGGPIEGMAELVAAQKGERGRANRGGFAEAAAPLPNGHMVIAGGGSFGTVSGKGELGARPRLIANP